MDTRDSIIGADKLYLAVVKMDDLRKRNDQKVDFMTVCQSRKPCAVFCFTVF